MTQYAITTIAVSVHPQGANPIYSESATHLRIEDDGCGPFRAIRQNIDGQTGEVRMDKGEIRAVLEAALALMAGMSIDDDAPA